ncbi:MAG TPA: S-methyl-5-thioribose-1-phosphate isomerase [Pelomicrobium sp.]|nr:S-methyl-5-thioribose-1-phosphate isomerase [Pelomicrobium sp.]
MPAPVVETLRWARDRIELIDQRRLPMAFEYVACRDAAEVADAIRAMVVRGAPAIGCAAAYGVALEALKHAHGSRPEMDAALELAQARLAQSRPTAVNLFWALARMRRVVETQDESSPPERVAAALLAEAHAIREADVAANRRMGELGAALLPELARVMTYCNAGALATAGHGTALGVIRSACEAGKRLSVYACETRPFLQGARLTAWELTTEGIPATLITDNMAGFLMSRGEIDAVVVGADRVAANGDVANKIGTYTLAVLAQRHAVPFYVACPLSTIDRAIASGAEIPIEERPPAEVTGYGGMRWAPPEIAVRNPAFDVTPAALVTALVTERKVVPHPDAGSIAALFSS